MFNRQFKARLVSFAGTVRSVEGQDPKRTLAIILAYDFTDKLAAEIGGKAPALQEMLSAEEADEAMTVRGSSVSLDTKHVRVLLGPKTDQVEIPVTFYVGAKAKAPTKGATNPTLEVKIKFVDDDKGAILDWVWCNTGDVIAARMDRRQLELPTTKTAEDPEEHDAADEAAE
jgi:hypothetical protein